MTSHMEKHKHTKRVGIISEIALLSKFTSLGYTVSVPYGDCARYDFIVDFDDGKLARVQCKTGRVRASNIEFNTCSTDRYTQRSKGYEGEIDYFAIWVPELSSAYLIPFDNSLPSGKCRLRLDTKLHESITRYADDYLM